MQVTIGLWGKARDDAGMFAVRQIGIDDRAYEI